MRLSHAFRRWAARGGAATVAAIALAGGMQVAGGAQASAAGPPATANPYSPAYHHPYRQGVIPTRPQLAKMRTWARSHPAAAAAASPNDLNYGGGIDGIGVTTGQEKVYLVFYGAQWGTQSTNASGDVTLSGDPSGEAPYLQELFKGLGTNGELWSGVMTQYCDGVAVGAQSCPAGNTQHVDYPGQRGRPLRQHHRCRQPGRPVRHHLPHRHPPRRVQHPGRGVLRLARLER